MFDKELDLESHLDNARGDCPKQPVECLFQSIGCNLFDCDKFDNFGSLNYNQKINNDVQRMDISNEDQGEKHTILRENLADHMQKSSNYHLSLIHFYYNKEINNMKLKFDVSAKVKQEEFSDDSLDSAYLSAYFSCSDTAKPKIKRKSPPSCSIIFGSSKKIKEKLEPIGNMDDSRFELLDYSKSTKFISDFSEIKSEITESKMHHFDNKLDQNYQNLSEKIGMIEANQNGLITDLTRITKNNDRLKHENNLLKDSIKEYKNVCQDLHKALALTQVSLLTLEERLINQEKISVNGCLLWRITNVYERIQEAKSGRQTSFYSPPFYTARDGYKMCARIYLNGDGNGRNTHLSLFFVILRGEYDALLTWPFRQKVTFTLLDQSESKEHVVDAFRPDPNSSSFKRPISEMNIASGLPVFCPLGKLMSTDREFIKDNTMFIKIKVDCESLEGTIPPKSDEDLLETSICYEESNQNSTNTDSLNRLLN
jgi:hypothetical protein